MESIKEIILFVSGSADVPRTWSNVPYFLTTALRAHGITVDQVDIKPNRIIEWTFNHTLRQFWKIFFPRTTYTYARTWLHSYLVGLRIRRAARLYPGAQLLLGLTYSHFPHVGTDLPVVLFCDWTYRYSIEHYQDREPDPLEARAATRDDRNVVRADLVIPLFQVSAEYMRSHLQSGNIFYLGQAVNAPSPENPAALPQEKAQSHHLLFIGNQRYLPGLRLLLAAFELLKESHPDLTLSIIGMPGRLIGTLPPGVSCHGYLDKGQPGDRNLFYAELRKARCMVNPTPKWGGFSSILEALIYFTPVIISPFEEATCMFGQEHAFVSYCEQDDSGLLARRIEDFLCHPDYAQLARQAHAAVQDLTWANYVDRLLALIADRL